MTRFRTLRLLTLASLTPLLAAPALSQSDSYFYGGLSAGRSRSSLDDERIAVDRLGPGISVTGLARDRDDNGYKLFGGYQLNRNLGFELGGFQLGRFDFNATTAPAGTLDGSYRVRGLNFDVVGTLPVTESLAVIGRVGAIRTRTHSSFTGTGAASRVDPDTSRSDSSYKLGAGLQYAFSPSFLMRGEIERYRVSAAGGGHAAINLLSVSLVIPFGRGSAPTPRAAAPTYTPPAYTAMAPAARVATPAPAPAPQVVVLAPVAAPVAMPPTRRRTTYAAESLFGFDRSTLQPAGMTALDSLLRDVEGSDYSVINVEGHTDRIGSTAYNQELSLQRARAVSAYLSSTGRIDASKISIVGQGESQPITKAEDCKGDTRSPGLVICLQPDRRVEIEIIGTR